MKTFLSTFVAVLLAILASAGILYFAANRLHSRHAVIYKNQISAVSPEEAYARQVMKGLSADDVISVCGKPLIDHVGNYGEDYKWRVLSYPHFEANFILKDGHWQYDFMSNGDRVLPDASMVTRTPFEGIKLPCQP